MLILPTLMLIIQILMDSILVIITVKYPIGRTKKIKK